jgi:hypothetical protein
MAALSRRGRWALLGFALAVAAGGFYLGTTARGRTTLAEWAVPGRWQRLASPGDLSVAHAALDRRCADCHATGLGPVAKRCLACHAGERSLLARQPTAFHAAVTTCADCHPEHLGRGRRPTVMSHETLATIGREMLARAGSAEATRRAVQVERFVRVDRAHLAAAYPLVTAREAVLDCATCHAAQDRHRGAFSADCALCHATSSWSIADYRHPSPDSVQCAECHLPPKSHLMEHFTMVSQAVARQPTARVEQCHVCHQTTAWLDIRGIGWYEHH